MQKCGTFYPFPNAPWSLLINGELSHRCNRHYSLILFFIIFHICYWYLSKLFYYRSQYHHYQNSINGTNGFWGRVWISCLCRPITVFSFSQFFSAGVQYFFISSIGLWKIRWVRQIFFETPLSSWFYLL